MRRLLALLFAAGGLLVVVLPVGAATSYEIAIRDDFYDPKDIEVVLDPADNSAKVTWSNIGTHTHSVTSASGAWTDSGDLPGKSGDLPPSKFILTIQRPGIYNYFCRFHQGAGMTGVLRVREAGGPAPTSTTAAPATTTTVAPVTTTTAAPVTTTTTESTTTTTESTTTTVEETTTTTSTTAVALPDDDDDDDESSTPLRVAGVASVLAAAAATIVQARRFLSG